MVRQREGLAEMVPHTWGVHLGRVGRSARQEGLWEQGGESRTSQGLCRSRLS